MEEEPADVIGDVVLDVVDVDRIHALSRLLDGVFDEEARFVEEFLRFAQIDEAAADDVGGFAQAAGLRR